MSIPLSHMKERLSAAYVQAVAARAGVKLFGREVNEYGVDGYFQQIREWRKDKYKETGEQIQCQVKATWEWGFQGDLVYYDMKTKAYDKLVDVVEDDSPTIFILFCLPKEEELDFWLKIDEQNLVLKNCCYWDYITGEPTGKDDSTKRIKIPRTQLLSPDIINEFFEMLKRGEFK